VLLCGERDIFRGTFVQKLHNFISGGACDYFQTVVGFCCGERGEQACAKAEDVCCDRPNPVLQLFYLLLLGGCYFAILYSSLHYIPGHYVSALHRYSHWTPSNGDLLFLSFFECISFTWSFAIANEYVMATH
jgi:hypothetical protein